MSTGVIMNDNLALVLNCGSSSIKFAVVDPNGRQLLLTGLAERLNSSEAELSYKFNDNKSSEVLGKADHYTALQRIIALLRKETDFETRLSVIGHRVLHGGARFVQSTLINAEVEQAIEECSIFGPLHNPANLLGIRAAKRAFPNLPQVAVFDTAFHQTMPDHVFNYAIPYELSTKHGLRKYGFHGTSHHYVSQRAIEILQLPTNDNALIIAHLGNGSSVSAVLNGCSVDTSMGLTPLEGLMMGTRSGDLDPSLVIHLINNLGYQPDEIDNLLNKQSGLLGVSGVSSDMRNIIAANKQGNRRAELAFEMFCYRVAKYIASYIVPLGRIDALVFTGGIGENSENVRSRIITWLAGLGFRLDSQRNGNDGKNSNSIITSENCQPIAMVVPTNEELMIAIESYKVASTAAY